MFLQSFVLIVFLCYNAHGQSCTISEGKDVQGNDYYNIKGQLGDCCRLCHEAAYCRAYSWSNYEGGTCWLKYAASPVVDVQGVTLGILNGNTCRKSSNSDIKGQDLNEVSEQPEGNCCDICSRTKGCNAYAWSEYNGGTCFLKSATGPIISNPGVSVGVLCVGGGCSESQSAGCRPGWKTVKRFEFSNMNQVNQDWNLIILEPKHYNNELQAYVNSPSNIFTKNGHLVIRAAKSGDRITSGRLESKAQFSPRKVPGKKLRVEFTAKVPAAMGAWPGLWMIANDGEYGPWPVNGEIDLMEWVWQSKNNIMSALHWQGPTDWSQTFSDGIDIKKISTYFHTYGVEYSIIEGHENLQFYIRKPDGQTIFGDLVTPEKWRYKYNGNCKPNCPPMAPFDTNMNLIMNLAVGGDWGGCCRVQGYDIFESGIEMEISSVDICSLAVP